MDFNAELPGRVSVGLEDGAWVTCIFYAEE